MAVAVVTGCCVGTGADKGEHAVAGASASSDCARPYGEQSPWNRPIGAHPAYQPASAAHIRVIARRPLTSDPTQYTYPVYEVPAGTPRRSLLIDGVWSDVQAG